MRLRVVALGDSTSCGEGVGLGVPPDRTWPALLTAAVPGGHLRSLALAGSRVRDVRLTQLPAAVALGPQLATLLIGLNDVSRGGFEPPAFAADLHAVVRGLRRTGAVVLLGRLHDPTAHLPLPPALRRAVQRRVAVVNAAVDAAAAREDALVLDLGHVPALRLRAAFDVDRLHPSPAAHVALAAAAADVLRGSGVEVGRVDAVPVGDPAGPLRSGWWALRHGGPWLAGHGRSVVLPAAVAAVRGER